MALSCKITPKVKDRNGNAVDSHLHTDLYSWTLGDRTKQNNIWGTTRTRDFVSKYGDSLERDAHGEFKAIDVISKTPIKDEMSDEELISGLQSEPLAAKTAETPTKAHALLKDVMDFNEHSPLNDRIEASVTVNDNVASVSFTPINEGTQKRRNEAVSMNNLHTKLVGWLERHGVTVGILSEAEQAQGIDAVTDFSTTKRTASGLIELVRLAKGEKGHNALTEEAAHVAVAALAGKDANVDRTLRMLEANENLVRQVLGSEYENYSNRYEGNKKLLAEEAAGQILKSQLQEANEEHKLPTHRSLFSRIISVVKSFFGRADGRQLETMLDSAITSMRAVAEQILDDDTYEQFDFEEMSRNVRKLYAVTKSTHLSVEDYLQKLIQQTNSEVKSTRRGGKRARSRRLVQEQLLNSLLDKRAKGEYVVGVTMFLNSMLEDMKIQSTKWERLNWNSLSAETKAEVIDRCITAKNTYSNILEDYYKILTAMEDDPEADQATLEVLKQVKDNCDQCKVLVDDLSRKAIAKSLPSVVEFAKLFADTAVVVPFGKAYGKEAGQEVSFEDTLLHEDKDIAWYDLWLTSGAMSNSFNVQVLSKIINSLQLKIRDEALDYNKRLKDLTIRLEEAGYDNQDFMYERDEHDELTGKFITKGSKQYGSLSPIQQKYYDDVMDIKKELDAMLPPYVTSLLNAPKIRKDFWEVIKNAKGDRMKVVKDKMKEMWTLTSDDEYTLKDDAIIIDYNGNQVHTIPLRFLAFGKDENMNNMSTDIVEAMSLYAQMATNFSIMTRVLPFFKNALELIKDNTTGKVDEEKVGTRMFNTFKGIQKRGEGSNEVQRLQAIYDSQLYGMKVYNTSAGGVNLTKLGHNLMQWTALNQYAMNPHGALQNEITGLIMEASEAFGGRFFGHSDLLWAHATYVQNLPQLSTELGKRIKNSKISLFVEKLNILQETDREQNFNRKSMLGRLVDSKLPYCMTGVGEHNLHTLTGLAMAHRISLLDANGERISLWDALEVVTMAEKKERDRKKAIAIGDLNKAKKLEEQIAAHPEWKDGKVMTLEPKEGLTLDNGKPFGTKELLDETRKIMAVNHRLHGIYNEEDKAKAQQYVIGQMGLMYRKWMAPAMYRRFQGLNYSQDLHEWEEGYYITLGRKVREIVTALYTTHSLPKNDLTELEKQNLKRAAFELALWSVMLGLKAMLAGMKKKRHREYAFHVLNYFVVRTASELNAYIPFGIPRETLRLMQSPTAVLSSTNGFLNFLYASVNLQNYEWYAGEDALLKSGPNKGMSRIESAFWKSGIPIGYHQLDGLMHLDQKVKFYE